MSSENCPFCGQDPYHYVDNGVGMEAVAINCCELGVPHFEGRASEQIEEIAQRLYALISASETIQDQIDYWRAKAEETHDLEAAS